MGILSWIIVGLIAGWLAGVVMRGGYGLIGDIIVGIIGAILGGFIAGTVFGIPNAMNGISITSIIIAFLGAVILIAILRAFSRGRARV